MGRAQVKVPLVESYEADPIKEAHILELDQCFTERAWMVNQLSFTPILKIHDDGSFKHEYIKTDFYLTNNEWRASHFWELDQFASQKGVGGFKPKKAKRPGLRGGKDYRDYIMRFRFSNPGVNLEVKFVFHQMLFSGSWSLNTACFQMNMAARKFAGFVNERHADASSLQELLDRDVQDEFYEWLEANGYEIWQNNKLRGKGYRAHTPASRFPTIVQNYLDKILADYRAVRWPDRLWDGDVWKAEHFEQFGINDVKTSGSRTIDFSGIANPAFKELCKRFLKERVLTHAFSWSTAIHKRLSFETLANFISEEHPEWSDFCDLSRSDMLRFMEVLGRHGAETKRGSSRTASSFVANKLSAVRTLLQELQLLDYPEAPHENVYRLILSEDTIVNTKKKAADIKFVPDSVIDQLFESFDKLGKNWQPIILALYYTGLRVSDVLELKTDCIITVNGRSVIETDIRKTKVEGHRIPIPDDFAKIMKAHIAKVKEASNEYTNPKGFIFVHLDGYKRGYPYSQSSVYQALNELAIANEIVDEDGNIYHFKNHAFRHTYAVRLLNNGAGLMTVQELLAHRSPEMTLAYAKLLDETKFREFEKAVKGGAFTFETDKGELVYHDDVPEDVLRLAWSNYKYNAVDTPYGTCLQRKNGRCKFASQPPCLYCDDGKPCKDLCVGAVEGDLDKYNILIDSARKMAQSAHEHDRPDMAAENEELVEKLEGIRNILLEGGIIYGRRERLEEQR